MPVEPEYVARSTPTAAPELTGPAHRWVHKAGRGLLAVLCMGLGALLVIAPWGDAWQQSHLPSLGPEWRGLWVNTYFRGAVSGLGIVDIYIAIHEMFGLLIHRAG